MKFLRITPQSLFTILALFLFSITQTQAQPGKFASNGGKPKLASVYAGNDGGAFYWTQTGNKVFCFAEHPGKDYAYVIHGTRSGNIINGKFWGVPKEGATKTGTVKLQILGNGAIKRLSHTGGFPAATFNIKTIGSIKNLLPRPKKTPGFTTMKLSDLDGSFKDANGYYYYFRQTGNKVVMFCEKDFKKGQQPAGAYVFIGTRAGNTINGALVSVPKGIKKAKGTFSVKVHSNGKLVKQSAVPFGGPTLNPIIPIKDIPIPVKGAIDILDSQLKYIKVKLDNYDSAGKELKNGSYVKFNGMPTVNFHIPMLQVTTCASCKPWAQTYRRSFVNDMNSDIVQVKSLGGSKMRLTVIFESGGREIKRYCRKCAGKPGDGGAQDNIMQDWDIKNPRIDVEIQMINKKTSKGKSSISYKVNSVKLHASVDAPRIPDSLEDWIMKKFRPDVEKRIKDYLNAPQMQTMVANKMYSSLQKASNYLNQYKVLGYNILDLQPKGIVLSGSNVVFKFK